MMDPRTRVNALVRARQEVLSFCGTMTEDQWQEASQAPDWRVEDVFAHVGSGCHAISTPAALTILRAPWRDRRIELLGDADYAATILDQVDVV